MDAADARKLAVDLNAARRQMTPADLAAARAERVARVKVLRGQGKSTREIAAEVGTHKTQVLRDLKQAEVDTLCPPDTEAEKEPPIDPAPEPPPPRVTGRDGKRYPAAKPKVAKPKPPADPPLC